MARYVHTLPAMMRKVAFSFLAALGGAYFAFACSSKPADDTEVTISGLTDLELGRQALKIMGAPLYTDSTVDGGAGADAGPNRPPSCAFAGCHSINTVTLKQWNQQYLDARRVLESDMTNEQKIAAFRQTASDSRTSFAPERLGIISAGAHLGLGANVSPTAHPETYAQGTTLKAIFGEQTELYDEFRREVLMPVLPNYPRLTATQYETVLTWFKKGMPHLNELVPEVGRPTTCVDDLDRLRERTIAVKNSTWAAKNISQSLPMFGCAPPNPAAPVSATRCFEQQIEGKDIFPKASDVPTSAGWALDGSTVRILRNFSDPNSYWVRTSADGRFVATGGGRTGGAQAIDLQATLEGRTRDIGLRASYDPDFWPDNKGFMFQGGTKFCAQSLLEKPATSLVTFGEPECSSLSNASGLYQTVGQVVGDNSIGDRFILFSTWVGDSGSYSAFARDTQARAGDDSTVNIFTAVALGNDVEEGYTVPNPGFEIATPYRGDTMMARSGKLLGSRWSYAEGADGRTPNGYAVEKLDWQVINGKYRFTAEQIGNVCMPGNKANFSFDERFLATHHYNEPSDFAGETDPAYLEKGSSDIYVVDFITGKKVKVTKMGPGQFALYAHFRSDGWLHFLVVDYEKQEYKIVASDWAIRQAEANPTP